MMILSINIVAGTVAREIVRSDTFAYAPKFLAGLPIITPCP